MTERSGWFLRKTYETTGDACRKITEASRQKVCVRTGRSNIESIPRYATIHDDHRAAHDFLLRALRYPSVLLVIPRGRLFPW